MNFLEVVVMYQGRLSFMEVQRALWLLPSETQLSSVMIQEWREIFIFAIKWKTGKAGMKGKWQRHNIHFIWTEILSQVAIVHWGSSQLWNARARDQLTGATITIEHEQASPEDWHPERFYNKEFYQFQFSCNYLLYIPQHSEIQNAPAIYHEEIVVTYFNQFGNFSIVAFNIFNVLPFRCLAVIM